MSEQTKNLGFGRFDSGELLSVMWWIYPRYKETYTVRGLSGLLMGRSGFEVCSLSLGCLHPCRMADLKRFSSCLTGLRT